MDVYTSSTWALDVYGDKMSAVDIAKKVGLGHAIVSRTKTLNDKLLHIEVTDKITKLKKGLVDGSIKLRDAMTQLDTAANIDNFTQ